MADSISATPQNSVLAALARALRFREQAQTGLNSPTGTLLDLILPTSKTVERWSYGDPIMRMPPPGTGGYVPVPTRDKEYLAETLSYAPIGLPAKAAASGVMMTPPIGAIKPKGGNWLSGTIDDSTRQFRQTPNWIGGDLINQAAGENLWAKMVQEGGHHDPHAWLRANRPDIYDKMVGPEGTAINRWLDTKLNKYIRNEMGTPDDPVKALAERGVLHFQPQGIRDQSTIMDRLRVTRQAEGFPAEGTAVTPLGQQWERYSDYAIEPRKVGNIQSLAERGAFTVDRESARGIIEENPWIAKLDPESKVYGARWSSFDDERLGFDHLIDELKNAMDPNSTLPRNLRIDPKDIDKITVPQAVERVAKINAWRAEEAVRAEKAGMLQNLQATPRMADDSFRLSFVDKPGGAWVDIPETVNEKGMKLCTSISKAGGWCTQQEWAAKSYGSGKNRLVALLDTEGRPHAQAKISSVPSSGDIMEDIDDVMQTLTPAEQRKFNRYLGSDEFTGEQDEALEWLQSNLPEAYNRYVAKTAISGFAPDITELKPPGNSFSSDRAQEYAKRDPEYKAKMTDAALNFLNSRQWGDVKDLDLFNIVDIQNPDHVVRELRGIYGRDIKPGMNAFNAAVDDDPYALRFMKRSDFLKFIEPFEPLNPPKGMADGGLVQKYAFGGLSKQISTATKSALNAVADKDVNDWLAANPGATDVDIAAAMQQYNVAPEQVSRVTGIAQPQVQQRFDAATQPQAADPASVSNRNGPMKTLNDLASAYSIANYFIPGFQAVPILHYGLKALSLGNTIKSIGRRLGFKEGGAVEYDAEEIARLIESTIGEKPMQFAAGGPVNYDPTEIDTIVSRVKEELHA